MPSSPFSALNEEGAASFTVTVTESADNLSSYSATVLSFDFTFIV